MQHDDHVMQLGSFETKPNLASDLGLACAACSPAVAGRRRSWRGPSRRGVSAQARERWHRYVPAGSQRSQEGAASRRRASFHGRTRSVPEAGCGGDRLGRRKFRDDRGIKGTLEWPRCGQHTWAHW